MDIVPKNFQGSRSNGINLIQYDEHSGSEAQNTQILTPA